MRNEMWLALVLLVLLVAACGQPPERYPVVSGPTGVPPAAGDEVPLDSVAMVDSMEPMDAAPEAGEPSCEEIGESSLPGAQFDLTGNPCVITLAEVAQGFGFEYTAVLKQALQGVISVPGDAGMCDQHDPSGLRVQEKIYGNGQIYWLNDLGQCGYKPHGEDLQAGEFENIFEWDGTNWNGPSDTGMPQGDPFPPGVYTFRVEASGSYNTVEGAEAPFQIWAERTFHLVK
jgi:hypothetical protein